MAAPRNHRSMRNGGATSPIDRSAGSTAFETVFCSAADAALTASNRRRNASCQFFIPFLTLVRGPVSPGRILILHRRSPERASRSSLQARVLFLHSAADLPRVYAANREKPTSGGSHHFGRRTRAD